MSNDYASSEDKAFMYHETCNEECPENCNSSWLTYKKLNNDSTCIRSNPDKGCDLDTWHNDDNITIRCGNMEFEISKYFVCC